MSIDFIIAKNVLLFDRLLKSTLRNLFAHYSSEISNKFPSFLLFIAATLQRATVHELLMRLHIDVRETLKRNVYFWKRLLCRAMLAELSAQWNT